MAERVVKVYSSPTCPFCKRVKSFLDNNGIKYQDMNVSEDKSAREEMVNISHQMVVPQTVIDGQVVIGFNEKELKEKLGIQ
jgi:glutaredoxin-like YruB-family protein